MRQPNGTTATKQGLSNSGLSCWNDNYIDKKVIKSTNITITMLLGILPAKPLKETECGERFDSNGLASQGWVPNLCSNTSYCRYNRIVMTSSIIHDDQGNGEKTAMKRNAKITETKKDFDRARLRVGNFSFIPLLALTLTTLNYLN